MGLLDGVWALLRSHPDCTPAPSPSAQPPLAVTHPAAEARYVSDAGREAIGKFRAQLLAAADALDALLAPAQCPALVQAIVQKYIMLSPDEVAEWGSDPER